LAAAKLTCAASERRLAGGSALILVSAPKLLQTLSNLRLRINDRPNAVSLPVKNILW
jgi:hypothetical protein